jgi:hypothetical protein
MKWRVTVEKILSLFDLRDGFVFGGLACAVYGIAQIYAPMAWIVTGAVLFFMGLRGK